MPSSSLSPSSSDAAAPTSGPSSSPSTHPSSSPSSQSSLRGRPSAATSSEPCPGCSPAMTTATYYEIPSMGVL